MLDPFPLVVTRPRIVLAAGVQAVVAIGVFADSAHAASWSATSDTIGLGAGAIWALAAIISVGLAAWLAANAFASHDQSAAANDNSTFQTKSTMLGSPLLRER